MKNCKNFAAILNSTDNNYWNLFR